MANQKSNNSYGLIETSPKLTGNVKIVVDESENVFLSTFDEDDELVSDRTIKRSTDEIKTYSEDLRDFARNIPNKLFFRDIRLRSDLTMYGDYESQFERTYQSGLRPLISRLYDEEFKYLAPLYLDQDIPQYFVVFRVEGPVQNIPMETSSLEIGKEYVVSVGRIVHEGNTFLAGQRFTAVGKSFNRDTDDALVFRTFSDTVDPDYYRDIISSSELVKAFDLTERTKAGRYIRRHMNSVNYSDNFIDVNLKKGVVNYTGINVRNGVISRSSKNISEFIVQDRDIVQLDRAVSSGFEENSMVSHKILNIEFVFDDDVENYKFYRYYGMYCDFKQMSELMVDKSVFEKSGSMPSSFPFLNTVPYSFDREIQVKNSFPLPFSLSRGVIYPPEERNNLDAIQCIRDANNDLLLLDRTDVKFYETNLKVSRLNLNQLFNINEPRGFKAFKTNSLGRASTFIEINTEEFTTREYFTVSLKNRELQPAFADYVPDFEDTHIPGVSTFFYFYPEGTREELATSIAGALEYILTSEQIPVLTYALGNRVYIISEYPSIGEDISFNFIGDADKVTFYDRNMIGQNSTSSFRVVATEETDITVGEYVQTESGYSKIKSLSLWLGDPEFDGGLLVGFNNVDLYRVINLEEPNQTIKISREGSIKVSGINSLEYGLLSFYHLKKFDTDLNYSDYTKKPLFELEKYYKAKELNLNESYEIFSPDNATEESIIVHDGVQYNDGDVFVATSSRFDIIQGDPVVVDVRYRRDPELASFNGFGGLASRAGGLPLEDNIQNKFLLASFTPSTEYEFNYENINERYALLSKINPTVFKWVRPNSTDVRGNPYRLNTSRAFRASSFAPSFFDFSQSPNDFTHEFYFLASQPQFINRDDLNDFQNYILEDFDISQLERDDINYFDRYFTLDTQIIENQNNFEVVDLNRSVRFTQIISSGNEAQTFFRGADIRFTSLDGVSNIDELNGYKFSCILQFQKTELDVIKPNISIDLYNNKSKRNMTLVITAVVDDYKVLPRLDGSIFGDYTFLYVMNSLKRWDGSKFQLGLEFPYIITIDQTFVEVDGQGNIDRTLTTFRGVQLPVTVDYTNFFGDTNVLKFGDSSLISDLVIPRFGLVNDELVELGTFGNLVGQAVDPDVGPISVFTTQNSFAGLDTISVNGEVTIDSLFNDRVILQNSGISANTLPGLAIPFQVDPVDLNNSFFRLDGLTWYYQGGGGQYYESLSRSLSFASIVEQIVTNGKNFTYYSKAEGESFIKRDREFNISFNQPVNLTRRQTRNVQLEQSQVEGTNLTTSSINNQFTGNSNAIFRYGGSFEPKSIDVLKFRDELQVSKLGNTNIPFELADFNLTTNLGSDVKATFLSLSGELQSFLGTTFEEVRSSRESLLSQGGIPQNDSLIDLNVFFDFERQDFDSVGSEYFHRVNERDQTILVENPTYPVIDQIAVTSKPKKAFVSQWEFGGCHRFVEPFRDDDVFGSFNLKLIPNYLSNINFSTPETLLFRDFEVANETFSDNTVDDRLIFTVDEDRLRIFINWRNLLFKFIKANSREQIELFLKPHNITTSSVDEAVNTFINLNITKLYRLSLVEAFISKNTGNKRPIVLESYDETQLTSLGYRLNRNLENRVIDNDRVELTTTFNRQEGVSVALALLIERI